MHAISIKRMFAERIMRGGKRVKYRSWPTTHHAVLAIHASRPGGTLLGVVDVVDCKWNDRDEVWQWELSNPCRPAAPIAWKGRLKLWEVLAALLRVLKAGCIRPGPGKAAAHCRRTGAMRYP